MVVSVDPSGHGQFVTGREAVTFYSRIDEDRFDPPMGVYVGDPPLAGAKFNELTLDEIGGDADLAQRGAAITLWAQDLQNFIPKMKDKITRKADNSDYIIHKVRDLSLRRRFRCVVLKVPGQWPSITTFN